MAQTATTSTQRTFTVNVEDQIIDKGTFRMGPGGTFTRCKDHPELPKGTIIVSVGFAGHREAWAMTGRTPEECVKISGNCDSYFSHPYHNLDRYAQPIAEEYGIGFYYDLDETPATDEEIAKAIEEADGWIAQREAEKKAEAEAYARALEEVRAKYAGQYEEKVGGSYTDAAHVAKNMRRDLSGAFPGCKFSVRKQSYDCISIYWTDGPTEDEVRALVDKHVRNCERDAYNDDIWNYSDTAFTEIFGGVDYIQYHRDINREKVDALKVEIEAICPDTKGPGFHESTMPDHAGAGDLLAKYGNAVRCYWLDSETIAQCVLAGQSFYEAPTEKAPEKGKKREGTTPISGVEIVDYSEKAVAVTGDTKPHADAFKALGGRFNPRLSCGPGWIFSKKQEAALREALGL